MSITLPQPWPPNPWATRFRTARASDPRYEVAGMRFVTVQSPALGGRGDLAVYVPPGHAASPDLPVVVLLHGVYGSFWNWAFNGGAHVVMAGLMSDGAVGPMALLMPSDGLAGEGTAYLSGPTADYEAWVMDDAWHAPARRWPASPTPRHCSCAARRWAATARCASVPTTPIACSPCRLIQRCPIWRRSRRSSPSRSSRLATGRRRSWTSYWTSSGGRAPSPPAPRLRPRRSVARRQP